VPTEPDLLVVGDERDAVARARRFAIERALSAGHAELAADVELVTSELVTNGLLHAGPPIELRVDATDGGVRVEVVDTSAAAPLRALATPDAMTGRGLALVEALSSRWGAEQRTGGKAIWCELTPDGATADARDGAEAALLEQWDLEEADDEVRYVVRLGDVPTDLLLAAKAHVDNLVREFALAASGSTRVPPSLADLVDNVVHRFAAARQAIRRQALEAAARGDERTELVLRLPASAAAAGEAYLAALDQADAYARAARLLTLETPPQHRAFRHWYVESLVDQLRPLAAGETPPPPQTFEQRLLDEVRVVAAAQRASDRAARLHAVAAALAGATTPLDVANVAVAEGVAVLGADRGALILRSGEDVTVPAAIGHPTEILRHVQADTPDDPFPAGTALRTGEPVWAESPQQRDESFPRLHVVEPSDVAVCAYPLRIAERTVGALRFSFDHPHLFDGDERAFVAALAAQAGQALDRSMLYAAEREARAAAESYATRLARLQWVTAELAAVNDVDSIAEIVVTHAAEAFGAYIATLSVLVNDETLQVVRHSHSEHAAQWATYPADLTTPAGEAVVTNQPVVVRTGPDLDRRFPALSGRTEAGRSLVCVPLSVAARRIGVISLSFEGDDGFTDAAELGFLTTLADACSQAIDRARALEEAKESAEKLAFIAEASVELSSTLDYRMTLTNVARLVVPRLADWCAIQILNDGTLDTVAVAHVDPAKVSFAEELQRRYPPRLDTDTGVAKVLHTGRVELYPTITDEMLEAGAVDDEHLRISRELGLSSAIVAPLTGRTGTFGALTMIYAESGRHYKEADLPLVEDLARRAAVAVENAYMFRQQSGQLARITRVAEAAQHAILAPVPERVGPIRLAAAYASATREALVGGDLYEVVRHGDGVRLLVGDVRGKGLAAVRLATVVLGEFRAAGVERDSLVDVARQMDARLTAYLSDEDFVTAIVAEITADGTCRLVSCGHPPALLAHGGTIAEVGQAGSLPLGLGAEPVLTETVLVPGDRLLMFTDGLIEARDADGNFADITRTVSLLPTVPLGSVLDRMLQGLRDEIGGELGDDLALLLAEFAPADAQVPEQPAGGQTRAPTG
jgi:GAF domain-containing protein/anti-sigma regulatory factor (Ser/Thr protein kinase)